MREASRGPANVNTGVQEQFLAETLPALDLVYNLARRMLKRAEDVEDLVQETYLRAFEAWVGGRRPRKVEPWIATICLNAGRSFLRRASGLYEVLGEVEETRDPAEVDEEALNRIRREAVHAALWELPREQRIAIALMDLDGLTAAEVSRVAGWPRGTVLSRVHRGRKRLAEVIDRKVGLHEET
jgi:RNA polymerase sigma-70 factor (ECF subfamily)